MHRQQFSTVEFKANYTCNSRCTYCCAGNRQKKRSMRLAELRENVDFFISRYGINEVCLSGGEPTVHPDFSATLEYLQQKKLQIYLHTNGISFHDPSLAFSCSRYINRVLVGISFHDRELCHALTGTGKTFQKRLAGIANLLNAGIPLRTNTVILEQNYRVLPEIAGMIKSLGVKRTLFTLPFFIEASPQQVASFVPESFPAIAPYLQRVIELLSAEDIEVSLQGLPPCKIGEMKKFYELDPDRAFVDSEFQLEEHRYLFSGMLGYHKIEQCESCNEARLCWGFPTPGALGELGRSLSLPAGRQNA